MGGRGGGGREARPVSDEPGPKGEVRVRIEGGAYLADDPDNIVGERAQQVGGSKGMSELWLASGGRGGEWRRRVSQPVRIDLLALKHV